MRAAKRHALEPELDGLPVDAKHHASGQERHAQEGAHEGTCAPLLRFSRDGSQKQFALGIVVIDACQRHRPVEMEAEAITAFDLVEG